MSPLGTTAKQTWNSLLRGESACTALSESPYFYPASIETDRSLSPEIKKNFREKLIQRLPCHVAAPVLWEGREALGGVGSSCSGHQDDSPNPVSETEDSAMRAPSARDSLKGGSTGAGGDERRFLSFAPTPHLPRSCQFSHAAVEEALWDAKLLKPAAASSQQRKKTAARSLDVKDLDRVGVHLGVGIPSVADVGDVSHALFANPASGEVRYNQVHPFFVTKILGNTPTAMTSIEYGITGPSGSSVAACATGAYSIGEAAGWIQSGRADVVICGSTEACITPVAVAGFARMRALATTFNATPKMASRPFDTQRAGFVMGEGAGVLVLESEAHARARGLRAETDIYGEVRGFGLSSDAHHVAAPDPTSRGAARCIRLALEDGGKVPASLVQYVNAHATGTIGDTLELTAIQQALRPPCEVVDEEAAGTSLSSSSSITAPPLWVSSSKGGIGHLLGAAGSVEAVIALLALKHQRAPPNINLIDPCWTAAEQAERAVFLVPSPSSRSRCVDEGTQNTHNHTENVETGKQAVDSPSLLSQCEAVISTSFGFGGMNSALLFTKYV